MTTTRLRSLGDIAGSAQLPGYVPAEHQVGIVHLGLGAFHRAHQAVMTDDALAHYGGDWRIASVSLRSTEIATTLNSQNGLYTLLERKESGTTARVIASIDHAIANDSATTLQTLCDANVRVVTLTVTEAGYGIDRETRMPDLNNAIVAADLAQPASSTGVLGLLVESMQRRREAGTEPYTVLSCDNLPANGKLLRDGVIGFACHSYGDELANWIKDNIAFPCSMVDRITPASTGDTLQEATRLIGCEDNAAVETEPFCQWIIEEKFTSGRPRWESGGAVFVSDVMPYERMKLMMLNGSHSMLAYSGYLTNRQFVRDVMQDQHLTTLVKRHFQSSAALLEPLPSVNYKDYAVALTERFSNPCIAHQTFQIATDGTQKLPQRIFQPAVEALDANKSIRPFAFATAMWMRFSLQRHDNGTTYELHDPRSQEIARVVKDIGPDGAQLSSVMHELPELIPRELAESTHWRECISEILDTAFTEGCQAAVKREAEMFC